ncbi:hypothetical protein TWF281_001027 [Arthrobotrys megalospora]
MILSKILFIFTVCALHLSVSGVGANRLKQRDIHVRHQPKMNPAEHYYNSTGRGLFSGNFTDLEGSGLLSKRHPWTEEHQETLSAGNWPMDYIPRYMEFFFDHIMRIFNDNGGFGGQMEVPPGCRPIFAGCKTPNTDNPEFMEVCNFSGEKRTIPRKEIWLLAHHMLAAKIWDFSPQKRYSEMRDKARIQVETVFPIDLSTVNYVSLPVISQWLLQYSWRSTDPQIGVALYLNPPARLQTANLQKVWEMNCDQMV